MRQFLLALLKYLKLFIGCIHKSEIKTRLPSLEFGKICFQQLISKRWESACNHVTISFLLSKRILNPISLPKSDILRTFHDSTQETTIYISPLSSSSPPKVEKGESWKRNLPALPYLVLPWTGSYQHNTLLSLTSSLASIMIFFFLSVAFWAQIS